MKYVYIMGKILKNFYLELSVSAELDRRAISDPNFNRTQLINDLLKRYFALEHSPSLDKAKILSEIEKAKSTLKDAEQNLMSLSVKLTEVHVQELKQRELDDAKRIKDASFAKHISHELLRE